jgi:hypothetical protein
MTDPARTRPSHASGPVTQAAQSRKQSGHECGPVMKATES